MRGSGRFSQEAAARAKAEEVSIPFIAGQWSLLRGVCYAAYLDEPFQSPSLRGSGRFARVVQRRVQRARAVSIPFIAGQWSLRAGPEAPEPAGRHVSIPFIAGQWSLHMIAMVSPIADAMFQSPSLRGSGRFPARRLPAVRAPQVSIPFIAGQWSLRLYRQEARQEEMVSIPFIAGQWSLLPIASRPPCGSMSFNPLHCGAVVASPSHNALPSLRRPAAEFATCLRPPSLGVLAQVA